MKIFHIKVLQQRPKIHADPFDRLIIAQAQAKNLTVLTSDIFIPQYDVSVLL